MYYIKSKDIVDKRFRKIDKPKWQAVVLLFRDLTCSKILIEELDAKPYRSKVLYGIEKDLTYQAIYNDKRIGVITQCIWGGPQASILVEEIACLEIPIVLGIGACGSICKHLPKGSQVYVSKALVTDGTSIFYTEKEADKKNIIN